jgi:hypothetical protein
LPIRFRRELIERDRVPKPATARVWRTRQKTVVRRMARIDIRMPNPAKDSEFVPMPTQLFEIG